MISIILPTKNEPLIEQLIKEIKSTLEKNKNPYEIIAIDDSDDSTFDKLKKTRVTALKQKTVGLGGAIIEGLNFAKGDFLVTMDADFSHNPKYIPKLVDKSNKGGFDIVIGSRREPGGKIIGWNLSRKIISTTANYIGKHLAGIKASDITSGFRLYKKEVIDKTNFNDIKSKGYAFQLEILGKAKSNGFKIGSIPITFVNRKEGVSKLSKKEILYFLFTALRIRFSNISIT